MSTHKAFIIADGAKPAVDRLQTFARDKMVIVLDGAYHYAKDAGVRIDYLLGDFDAVEPAVLNEAKQAGIQVVHTPDQDLTDLEKAIIWCDHASFSSIAICAATGFRLDHTLYNIHLLSRYYQSKRPIHIYTDTETLFVIQDDSLHYHGRAGDGFAIFGAPAACVTTQGLRYDVKDYEMEYAGPNSVSNTMAQDEVLLAVQGTALVIHQK